ncbi:MAG: hypothetical protein PWP37_218 [Thermotogota bacterium]|nr:hypothetical protein [Thermotogota bacterium]MDK2864026.1 hypothetical protein [Thermotogota bacterium]HCZ06234.1 hypothetical protein [Thermotogota bacterium]
MLKVNLYQRKVRKLKLQTFLILFLSLVIAGFSLNYLFSTYLYLTLSSTVKRDFPVVTRLGITISGDVSKVANQVKTKTLQLNKENQKLQNLLKNAKSFLDSEMTEHDYFALLSEFGNRFAGSLYVLKTMNYSPSELVVSLWEIAEAQPQAEELFRKLAEEHGFVFTRNVYNQYSLGKLKIVELSVSFKR